MKRAAVIIGVDRTGDLPPLRDAAGGARRVEAWALRDQGMAREDVILLTDADGGDVTAHDVKKAIRTLVGRGTVGQLLVYFAGHGVNIRYGEYWLLSHAPGDTQEAVNVQGSQVLARYCGIPHVLLVSDACRTAAEGVRAQFVTGSEIFPNDGAVDLEQPVDLFYACTLGRPAHEIRDPNVTTAEFSALYTGELVRALGGEGPVEWGDECGYVRPRPLKDHLRTAVANRLRDLNLVTRVIQVPDARITSADDAWIARIPKPAGPAAPRPVMAPSPAGGQAPGSDVAAVSSALLRTALHHPSRALRAGLDMARVASAAHGIEVVETSERIAGTFGPTHHETQCGFKIRGTRLTAVHSLAAETELFESPGSVVRVNRLDRPGASVLLMLEDGRGVVLPAIAEFIVALTVEGGELVDVAYEPSDNTWRWSEFEQRAGEIRSLRAIASAATRNGVFRLDGDSGLEVARRMQYAKGIDPTLAVYAAYAYDDLHQRERILTMCRYMAADIGAPLFDVALLSQLLNERRLAADSGVYGFCPLLSQGWALLSALRVTLPGRLGDLQRHLLPSPWTLFDAEGSASIRQAIETGEVI